MPSRPLSPRAILMKVLILFSPPPSAHSNLKPPAGLACVTFRYAGRNGLRLNKKMFFHQLRNSNPDGHNQNPSASQESQNNKSPHHVISAVNPILYRSAAAPQKHIKHTSQSKNRSFGGVFPTYDSIHVTPPVSLFCFHDRWDIQVFLPVLIFFSLSKHIGPCRNLVWLGGSQNE